MIKGQYRVFCQQFNRDGMQRRLRINTREYRRYVEVILFCSIKLCSFCAIQFLSGSRITMLPLPVRWSLILHSKLWCHSHMLRTHLLLLVSRYDEWQVISIRIIYGPIGLLRRTSYASSCKFTSRWSGFFRVRSSRPRSLFRRPNIIGIIIAIVAGNIPIRY